MSAALLDIPFWLASGDEARLNDWPARAYLLVNTASRCGFTRQYAGLEALQQRLGPQGLQVVAFPCNQFGAQEPDDDAGIQSFCATAFGLSFPVAAKLEVNGPAAHPLFVALKRAAPGLLGVAIKWNFTKFLVDARSDRIRRFAPITKPGQLERVIVTTLAG